MPTPTLTEFLFATPMAAVRLQLLEISHPFFTSVYRVCGNAGYNISVMHEDGEGPFLYSHFPVEIKTLGSNNSMDQELEIVFGDLGTILPLQLNIVIDNNGTQIKPTIVYREYSTLDLTEPMYGPFTLSINTIAFNKTGSIFTGKPIAFNRGRTGEVYDIGRFPMLKGLSK